MPASGQLPCHALAQPITGEPFPGSETGAPRHVELMHSAFNLSDPLDDMWALPRRELVNMLAHDRRVALILLGAFTPDESHPT